MNFHNEYRNLNSQDLHTQTFKAAENEKRATLELLEYLAEVDRRRLYAEKAYSSLWEYVHKFLNYSEAQASERVNAMRLMAKVPEVKEAISEGKLTLTSVAKLASFVRRENASVEQALNILKKCEGQPTRKVEQVLVQNSTQVIPLPEKVKAVAPEITRITLEVDEEFMSLIKRMKELKGNPAIELKEVFKAAMGEYVQKREPKNVAERSVVKKAATSGARSDTRYISVSIKNQIRLRSKDRCEFVSPLSLKRCESKTGLEFDHKVPHALGGSNELKNIRHLCKTHNLHHAIQSFGIQKMQPYLKHSTWERI